MRYVLSAFLILIVGFHSSYLNSNSAVSIISSTQKNKKQTTENKMYKAVGALPEMRSYFRRIDSLHKNTTHAVMIIQSKPSKNQPYYWLQVGTNIDNRLIAEYNFYVYCDQTIVIEFYDPVNDKAISLSEWRKSSLKYLPH